MPPPPLLTDADVPAGDTKARDALRRFSLSAVGSMEDPDFEAAYALLEQEFGAKGELERRIGFAGYFARQSATYAFKLVVARDERGEIAGVRDCHVSVDVEGRAVVVFLSHVLVLPPYRRTGLGGLLRYVTNAFARQAATDDSWDRLLTAEMEPTGGADTIIRLVAYGRAGFKIIDPRCFPYFQPDYREHALIDADRLRPVPLLAVVRWIGHEGSSAFPHRLARAFLENIYDDMVPNCRETDLTPLRAHTLGTLASHRDPVPLLAPPRSLEDSEAISALARDKVLAYYPASLLGNGARP
jgi:GNAT superfamily N-acetyltransferase